MYPIQSVLDRTLRSDRDRIQRKNCSDLGHGSAEIGVRVLAVYAVSAELGRGVMQSIRIIIKRLQSVVSQRENIKNDKPTISMILSHCIHQTLNSKASTRFHSGGLQQSGTLSLNTFLFGVIILIAKIRKRAFSSQLAAKLRNRLLVL